MIEFSRDARQSVFYDRDGLRVTAFLVDHPPAVPAVGYRFDYAGRSVVLSGDTRRSANLIAAARGADLLVHEVMADAVIELLAPALERAGNLRTATILRDALDNHTFPHDLFALAREAEVAALALYHLVPALAPEAAASAFTRGRDAFEGPVWVGEDGLHLVLAAHGSEPVRSADVESP